MRWATPLFALALAACGLVQPTGGTGATGSSPDAGTNCSTAGTCQDCQTCAVDGPCATVFDACEQNSDCASIDQCVAVGDTVSDCEANNPNGAAAFEAAAQCIFCNECPNQCPGQCM